MWVCKAVLKGGVVCETSNFDDWAQCSNCGAPRQANAPDYSPPKGEEARLGETLLTGVKSVASFSRDRAKEYAPVASAVAQKARSKASDIALHSRIATMTGVHLFTIIFFCALLLTASIAAPVLLHWPMVISVSNRQDTQTTSITEDPKGILQNTDRTSVHHYQGDEYSAEFVPSNLEGERKGTVMVAALAAGPILVSGSSVALEGHGQDTTGARTYADVSMHLKSGNIFWLCALVLIVLLIIADALIGDIYAMQKLLITLVLVWVGYCLLLGMLAQAQIKDVASDILASQTGSGASLDLSLGSLLAAPMKIAFIGLIYWMSSIVVRNLIPRRGTAQAK